MASAQKLHASGLVESLFSTTSCEFIQELCHRRALDFSDTALIAIGKNSEAFTRVAIIKGLEQELYNLR